MSFEYFENNMEKEIAQRKLIPDDSELANGYSEPEVWYIIETLVSLVKSFENRDYHHGDIQPKNLLIEEHGFIRVIDNSLINYGETAYSKMVFDSNYKAALSPKLIESLPVRAVKPIHDPTKSDLYSVGITALGASLNLHIDDFYDWNKRIIKNQRIRLALKEMHDWGFSNQLTTIIESLVDENEARRATTDELLSFFSRNQEQMRTGVFIAPGRLDDRQGSYFEQPKAMQVRSELPQNPNNQENNAVNNIIIVE